MSPRRKPSGLLCGGRGLGGGENDLPTFSAGVMRFGIATGDLLFSRFKLIPASYPLLTTESSPSSSYIGLYALPETQESAVHPRRLLLASSEDPDATPLIVFARAFWGSWLLQIERRIVSACARIGILFQLRSGAQGRSAEEEHRFTPGARVLGKMFIVEAHDVSENLNTQSDLRTGARDILMAPPPPALRAKRAPRGYHSFAVEDIPPAEGNEEPAVRVSFISHMVLSRAVDSSAAGTPPSAPIAGTNGHLGGMEAPNPLRISELLRLCVARVPASDLRACSLVSRSWVDAAQSYLFWELDFGRSSSKRQILEAPHLIRYIRRIVTRPVSTETLAWSCSFPFSHLEDVDIALTMSIDLRIALHLQQLLALPTIRRVRLISLFVESPSIFLRIWERASPYLRHLELFCHKCGPGDMSNPHGTPRIPLKSLRLISSAKTPDWIATTLSPFDLSGLDVLSVRDAQSLQGWPVAVDNDQPWESIDLALFPQLEVLRISINAYREEENAMTIATLSSIRPTSRIRDITIPMRPSVCVELDLALSRLPLPHPYTVTLEMTKSDYEKRQLYFPRLASSNTLRRSDPTGFWFRDLTRS
ncbi:hypothetical protein C8R46DRAFT_1349379 [Mycena filopes]|nr:hypothetical protein C8R46DRAFT_1349379 [Mycena filopes]